MKSIDDLTEVVQQCTMCNSEGETMIDEQRSRSIETQRLSLESTLVRKLNGIIKKQNDEIDMLIKQKQFLQSKLREKGNQDDKRR